MKKFWSILLCVGMIFCCIILMSGCGGVKNAVKIDLGESTAVTDYADITLKRVHTSEDVSATLVKKLYYTVDEPGTTYVDSIFDVLYKGEETIDSNDFMEAYAIGSDGKTKYKADLYCIEIDDYSTVSTHIEMIPQGQRTITQNEGGTTTFGVSDESQRFHAGIPVPEDETFVTIYYIIDGETYSYEYVIGEERISAPEITDGQTVNVSGVGYLTVNGVEFTEDLCPTNKSSDGYIHYTVADSGNIIAACSFTLRSDRSEPKSINTFLNVDCSVDGQEYETNVVIETQDQTGFSESDDVHSGSEVPVYAFWEFTSDVENQPIEYVIALGTEYFSYTYMP